MLRLKHDNLSQVAIHHQTVDALIAAAVADSVFDLFWVKAPYMV
jgi:hypothetical protein